VWQSAALILTMENTNLTENEKERIVLEYTAKGFANWTISLKDVVISPATLERLQTLDNEMRERFKVNVMNGGQ
jgi:hypothetical protein